MALQTQTTPDINNLDKLAEHVFETLWVFVAAAPSNVEACGGIRKLSFSRTAVTRDPTRNIEGGRRPEHQGETETHFKLL